MKLFLETSFLVGTGLKISSQKLNVLRRQLQAEHIPLITSQVVLDECANKFREDLQTKRHALSTAVRKMVDAVDQTFLIQITDDQVDEWVNAYSRNLEAVFSDEGGEILPYPDVPHEVVSERSRSNIKPYKKGNKDSYRDTLIWFSILEYLDGETSTPIYLLTGDVEDFSETIGGTKVLHSQLVSDVTDRGHDEDTVQIAESVESFIQRFIDRQIEVLLQTRDDLLHRRWSRASIDDDVEEVVFDYFEQFPLDEFPLEDVEVDNYEYIQIKSVSIIDYVDVVASRGVLGGFNLVIDVNTRCDFEVSVEKDIGWFDNDIRITEADDYSVVGLKAIEIDCRVSIVYSSDWQVVSTAMQLFEDEDFEVVYAGGE